MPEAVEAQPAQPAQPKEDPMALLQAFGDISNKLSQFLTTDEEKAKFSQAIGMIADIAEAKMGGGSEDEEMPADMGAVPAMGGPKGQPMGPQSKM